MSSHYATFRFTTASPSLVLVFAIEFKPRNRHERRAAKKRGRRR